MKNFTVICAHHPDRDPRVKWIYTTLSTQTRSAVKVIGFDLNQEVKEKKISKNLSMEVVTRSLTSPTNWLLKCLKKSLKIGAEKLMEKSQTLRFIRVGFWIYSYERVVRSTILPHINSETQILYANDFETLICAVTFKKKYPQVKIIYDCHEFFPYAHTKPPLWFSSILKKIESKYIKYVDEVISVNPLLAEKIAQTYKIKVHSLLNAEPYHPRKPQILLEKKEKNKKIQFLFQGGFCLERGLEEFLEAWEDIAPPNALLFLRGPDNIYKERLIQRVSAYSTFNKSVFFLESILEEELVEKAIEFDVGIIPYKPIDINYKYCCPNKLSQYMQAGLAVIGGNTKFVSQVIKNNKVGLTYDSSHLPSIRQAIEKLIDDRSFLRKCQKNSLELTRSIFNWQNEEKKLLKILEQY